MERKKNIISFAVNYSCKIAKASHQPIRWLDWPRFWNQFVEIIDKTEMPSVTKFAYLKSYLREVQLVNTRRFGKNGLFLESWDFTKLSEALLMWGRRSPLYHESPRKVDHKRGDKCYGTQAKNACVYCEVSSHKSLNCPNVVGPEERRKVLRNKRLCFNCTDSHFTSNFKSKVSCEFCHLKHHSSIHSPAAKKSGRSEKLKVKLAIKNAEIAYYNKQVTENKNHSASIWKTIRQALPRKAGHFVHYTKDTDVLAEEFNKFFISVGETAAHSAANLASAHGLATKEVTPRVFDTSEDLFMFQPVSSSEVQKVDNADTFK